ncbi:hypothetical protein MACH09_28460 [Vibrio sp. MACH09]|nr:hypothetical protein MACH09_28460 [Vibrio sp. MACH09]
MQLRSHNIVLFIDLLSVITIGTWYSFIQIVITSESLDLSLGVIDVYLAPIRLKLKIGFIPVKKELSCYLRQ